MCAYLEISTPIQVLSEMNLQYDIPHSADEWGLNVCKAIPGVTEYWNAPGGKAFFSEQKYKSAGIQLCFQKMNAISYRQKQKEFEPNLSILDLMMFNSVEAIQQMMHNFILL